MDTYSGHLAVVTSAEISAHVMDAFGWQIHRYSWIGANDLEEEGAWKWISNNLTMENHFTSWGVSEPNNFGGGEDCLAAKYGPVWNDFFCDRALPYICQF